MQGGVWDDPRVYIYSLTFVYNVWCCVVFVHIYMYIHTRIFSYISYLDLKGSRSKWSQTLVSICARVHIYLNAGCRLVYLHIYMLIYAHDSVPTRNLKASNASGLRIPWLVYMCMYSLIYMHSFVYTYVCVYKHVYMLKHQETTCIKNKSKHAYVLNICTHSCIVNECIHLLGIYA